MAAIHDRTRQCRPKRSRNGIGTTTGWVSRGQECCTDHFIGAFQRSVEVGIDKGCEAATCLQTHIRGLRTRLGMAQRMAARKERDIPETESDIALMKKLVEVGNRLRGYTELGIRVYVTTTNGEFDLLRTE